jgi:hypothetical protein
MKEITIRDDLTSESYVRLYTNHLKRTLYIDAESNGQFASIVCDFDKIKRAIEELSK